jgi:hypothetical protein
MFLPVILVSEFGNTAWFIFAIPNVIGAAAMGWTLAKPGASEKIVAEHRAACVAFSAVTLAFHLFFLYWLSGTPNTPPMPRWFAIAAVIGGLVFGLVGRRKIVLDFVLGFAVLIVSLTVMARGLAHPVFGVANPIEADRAWPGGIGLAVVCLFGFALCPYLDVTFHRARQQTSPVAGKWAFGIGFGVVFLTMIVLTLMYAGDFSLDKNLGDRFGSFGVSLLITWVAVHIASQAGFTIAAHLRALPAFQRGDVLIWAMAALLVGASVFAIRQELWFTVKQLHIAMLSGQLMYRLFMSFYGLVFPAYVWICMVPIKGRSPGPTRAALTVFVLSVAIAAPMFWLGFVNEWMLWLIPGVAVVMVARWVVKAPALQKKSPMASAAL